MSLIEKEKVISHFRSYGHRLSPLIISLLQEEGAVFLGAAVWGSSDHFYSFVGKAVDEVASLQERLEGLVNPQVEFHFLRSCFGVCKLNHLLRTISPNCTISQLERFDYNLQSGCFRSCLQGCCYCSGSHVNKNKT